MSQALARVGDTLTQYFLDRLAARSRAQFETEEQMKREQQRAEAWRTEQAAIGEKDRGVSTEIVGGNVFEVDKSKKWDPQSNSWRDVEYGRRLAPTEAPKEPRRMWVMRGGKEVYVAENEVKEGDRPLPKGAARSGGSPKSGGWRTVADPNDPSQSIIVDDRGMPRTTPDGKPLRPPPKAASSKPPKPESPMRDGRSKTGAYELEQGEPVRDKDGSVIGAPVFVMPPAAKPAVAQGGMSPAAAATLAEARDAIRMGADKDAVIAQLNPNDPDDAAVLAALRRGG